MAYVTLEYYKNTFHGESVDDSDFPAISDRASELVEEMTLYRLNPTAFESMPEEMQALVKKAVCAQIEYLDANGGSDLDNGVDLQSAGLGKFNYSVASDGSGGTQQSMYAPRSQRILTPTGLLYRGGGCY